MKIDSFTLMRNSFFLSFILTLVGASFRMMHLPGGRLLMLAGGLASLVYIVLCMYEIHHSVIISTFEKVLWFIGFVLFNGLAGLVYIFFLRNRIIRKS